jgi:hypothetical protein
VNQNLKMYTKFTYVVQSNVDARSDARTFPTGDKCLIQCGHTSVVVHKYTYLVTL